MEIGRREDKNKKTSNTFVLFVISNTFAALLGRMAEWLGTGLQNPLHRFESGSDLFYYCTLIQTAH